MNDPIGLMTRNKRSSYRQGWLVILTTAIGSVGLARTTLAQARPLTPRAPKLVVAWPAGPLDVIASFETAVDPAAATSLVGKTIPYFEPVEPAADRRGATRPLGSLRIVATRLSDSGRTLTLATDPHPVVARYLLPMPVGPVHPAAKGSEAGGTNYDLSGIEAAWTPEASLDDRPVWTGWWPSLDLERTRSSRAARNGTSTSWRFSPGPADSRWGHLYGCLADV